MENNILLQLTNIQHNLTFTINDKNFIGIFLYGSQNYHLSTSESDIDVIIIVYNAKRPHVLQSSAYGEVHICSLSYFLSRLEYGDVKFYEILYTDYYLINPRYQQIFTQLKNDIEPYVNNNRVKRFLSYKIQEHYHHILWLIVNPDHAYYNKKRLYWAIRTLNQLERLEKGESFKDSLIYQSSLPYDMLCIKTITNYLSIPELKAIIKDIFTFLSHCNYPKEALSLQEKECFTTFYMAMQQLYANNNLAQ